MHSTKKSIFKVSAFTIVIFILITTGCFFNQPLTPSTATEPANNEVRFTGTIDVDGMNSSAGRSAIAEIPSNIEYFVKAETPDDTPGGKLTVNVPDDDIDTTAKTFSINLKTGYEWKITVGIKDTANTYYPGDQSIILSDSFSKSVSATDTSIVHQFTLKPSMTGTGDIALDIYMPDGMSLTITDEENRFANWQAGVSTITGGYHLGINSISSGIYALKLKFQPTTGTVKKSFTATQVIAVYDSMKTNKWVSGGNALINSSGRFELTSQIYNASVTGQKNFYVDATEGNDTSGTGESLLPLKTVAKAIGIINAVGDTTSTYKIYAKAGGSESTNAQFTLDRNINVIVYENGAGKGPANPSGYYDFSYTGTGFLFTVNKSFSITGLKLWGPNNTSDSVGVSMGTSTSVFTMNSGVITNFACGIIASGVLGGSGSVINLFGGSIINNGQSYAPGQLGAGIMLNYDANIGQESPVLNVKGAPVVADNVTYAAGTDRNIALTSGEIITVIGPLTQGCDLRVSIPALSGAGNGNARQITEGYQANNGSVAPSSYFHGDQYAIGRTSSTSEVFLGQSGGSYSTLNLETISITRAESSPKDTKSYVTSLVMEFKIMDGANPLDEALEVFDITGYGSSFKNAAFYSTEARTGGGIKVTLKANSFPEGTYNVIVGLTHNGAKYDYSQKVKVAPEYYTIPGASSSTTAITNSAVFVDNRSMTIKPLIVCSHEVTQGEYETYCFYVAGAGSLLVAGNDFPAHRINWYDAIVYCNLKTINDPQLGIEHCAYSLNGEKNPALWDGRAVSNGKYAGPYNNHWNGITFDLNAAGWRLPTEAEWEYLARGGNLTNSNQKTYSGSNNIDEVAWYGTNSKDENHNALPQKICTKAPNQLGLYDMSGNAYEWCWDRYNTVEADTPYDGPVTSYPEGTHVLRGGSYNSNEYASEVKGRYSDSPNHRDSSAGFRVVRNAD